MWKYRFQFELFFTEALDSFTNVDACNFTVPNLEKLPKLLATMRVS